MGKSASSANAAALRVAAAVIRRGNKFLIARRPPGDRHAGKWEFPGGKIETGESPEDCLVRELQEELALACDIGGHLVTVQHRYPHVAIELIVHEAHSQSGEPHALVHDVILWVTASEMAKYEFAEADRPVVALLQKPLSA